MTFYTLIKTTKADGLEPCKYLKYIFTHLPHASTLDAYKKLLPQFIDLEDFNRFDTENIPPAAGEKI